MAKDEATKPVDKGKGKEVEADNIKGKEIQKDKDGKPVVNGKDEEPILGGMNVLRSGLWFGG
jgi:26S proteasome regulatory subunit N1